VRATAFAQRRGIVAGSAPPPSLKELAMKLQLNPDVPLRPYVVAGFAGRHVVLYSACVAAMVVVLAGCGGGSSSGRTARKTVRERAIASARLTRGTFAVAGIGRTITRATTAWRPRLRLVMAAVRHTRDTPPDFDPGTGLYFVIQANVDGSGQESLFADASHRMPAGAFVWQGPVWTSGVKNDYPAAIHTEYQINAGDYAGERGTIDFVADDATGENGTMHIIMRTAENERVVGDFIISNGVVRAKNKCSLPDGTIYDETDVPQDDGGMVCTIDYPDGSTETINTEADGTSTEVLTGQDGTMEANGSLDVNGTDDISFDDGSQEQVDVDTADAGDGGGSGDDGSDRRVRRPAHRRL
jgi:hypothetical protein